MVLSLGSYYQVLGTYCFLLSVQGFFVGQIFAQCTTRAGRRVSTVLLLVPLFSGEGTLPACFALPSVNRMSMFLHLENQFRAEKRRALVFEVQRPSLGHGQTI